MRKVMLGIVLGLLVGLGAPVLASDFGWTDTMKLGRIADASEKILAELQAIRAELKAK